MIPADNYNARMKVSDRMESLQLHAAYLSQCMIAGTAINKPKASKHENLQDLNKLNHAHFRAAYHARCLYLYFRVEKLFQQRLQYIAILLIIDFAFSNIAL
jgi:hypothetical protein